MLLNKLELTSHNPEQSLSIADNINGHGLWESNDKCQVCFLWFYVKACFFLNNFYLDCGITQVLYNI